MPENNIIAAVDATVAEQTSAVLEVAETRVEAAETMAAEVMAAAETTTLGVKIAAIEERLNSWQGASADFVELKAEVHELKQMSAANEVSVRQILDLTRELMDLLTEMEEEPSPQVTPPSTPEITAPMTATMPENSPPPDEKSEKPDRERQARKNRLI